MTVEMEQIGACTLYRADCYELLPELQADALVTDPPYGMRLDNHLRTGKNGHGAGKRSSNYHKTRIVGDDKPFDPTPWLDFPHVVLWGANHFARYLPVGATLIWIKRFDDAFGSFLSDAEIAWKKGGCGVFCRRDTSLLATTMTRFHPTEKPLGIMQWCLEKTQGHVCDPFMGSGTTGIACVKLRRSFVGIEIEPRYFDLACQRITDAYKQPDLFLSAPPPPRQEFLL